MTQMHTEEVGSAGSPTPRRPIQARGVDHRLRALKPEILALVESIIESGVIEKGPHVAALAREFQQLCHAPNQPVPCDSGTDALKMALLASGVEPDDEVLVPQLSFMSTVSAVHEVGATPVFVDIEAETDTYAMSPRAAEAAITARTRAVIPVHLFGLPVDADAFLAVGERSHLTIIGDAAQAHGASYKDRIVGNLGFAFETFSLAAVKNIGGWRFGGIVTYRDPAMQLLLHQLADLGRSPGERDIHAVHGLRPNMTRRWQTWPRLYAPRSTSLSACRPTGNTACAASPGSYATCCTPRSVREASKRRTIPAC